MSKTVLITGANGNIGKKLTAHFAALGWTLRLHDLSLGQDLATYDEAWAKDYAGVDAVIHLAGDPKPNAPWASIQRLNIDLCQNVYEAAVRHGARRLIFASSNWTMAGHRHATFPLTTDHEPAPVNPYGVSKLIGERLGRSYHDRWGLEVIAFRIGYLQRGENLPGPHMGWGSWGQLMWLSNRDAANAFTRAVEADNIGFHVLNLMSRNPGMRWDIDTTERVLGWRALDGAVPAISPQTEAAEATARLTHELAQRLADLDRTQKW